MSLGGDGMEAATQYCGSCRRTYDGTQPFCPLDGSALREVPAELPAVHTVLHDRYLILEPLATGGMGAIFRAHDMRARCEVALKVLKPGLAVRDQAVRRFFVEARAARRLDHPNIIGIRDFGVSREGFLYLAMELLPGVTLADVLRQKGRLALGESLLLALGVCEALIHAHEHGVVHRDLKPENIFLVAWDREGLFVKVLDFGVAAVTEAGSRGGLHRGEVLGTPAYMSPEQVRGDLVDRRSDLYSLGVVLYEMLAGVPPFLAESPTEVMRMHLTRDPPPLPPLAVTATVRRGVDRLLALLLRKRAEDRPSDASEVRALLRAVRDNLSVENATALDATLFLEVLAPLRTLEPFHERATLVVDPGAVPDGGGGMAGADRSRFHEQETLVLDPGSAGGARAAMTLLVSSGEDAVRRERETPLPWTLAGQRREDRARPDDAQVTMSLLHVELEFGHEDNGLMGTRALFAPEMEAFQAETLALGGCVCLDAGDEIRVAFGLFGSPEGCRDAAVRAAENLLRRVRRFRAATALPVSARAGVATDQVPSRVVRFAMPDLALRGSRVDVAVRLARMALPGQVVLDEETRAGVPARSDLHEIGRVTVRGRPRPSRVFALGEGPRGVGVPSPDRPTPEAR